MTRECTNVNCKCCKKEDHMMVMDGMEAFEPNNQTDRTGRGYHDVTKVLLALLLP